MDFDHAAEKRFARGFLDRVRALCHFLLSAHDNLPYRLSISTRNDGFREVMSVSVNDAIHRQPRVKKQCTATAPCTRLGQATTRSRFTFAPLAFDSTGILSRVFAKTIAAIPQPYRKVNGFRIKKLSYWSLELELDRNPCGPFYFGKAATPSLPAANEAPAVDLFAPGGAGQMRYLAWKKPAGPATLTGHDTLIMALMISFPVIGLDQFLRTTLSKFSEQPAIQIQHWLSDSLMALPLFAIGIWGGDLIARRAGLGTRRPVRRAPVRQALLISLLTALVMSLAWFQIDRTTNPVTAQPLVFPHARDSGDVYWVVPAVIVALCCVCLVPAAIWAGHALARGALAHSALAHSALARTAMLVLLAAAAPLCAWSLHQAAERAYSSQVYYTSAALSSRRGFRLPARAATAAPFAFAYQAAHALQDGLAGQAAGFPVAVMALRSRRGLDADSPHTRQTPQGDAR